MHSSDRAKRRVPYWLSYALTAGGLLALTGALVLIVLPSRYALVADLRESGISFPTRTDAVAFPMPQRAPLIEPPPPRVVREPGPAERLWLDLAPLLAARAYPPAIARMDAYLADHPEDLSVRRERARTLALAGRPAAARAAFEDLVRRAGAPADRLALARLLRDEGRTDAAIRLYRDLLAERPTDSDLGHELARLYMWAGRYGEAEAELRRLVAAHPRDGRYRLDLARALYFNDRPQDARTVLAGISADGAVAMAAAELDRELARVLTPPPEPEPAPPTLLELARRAAGENDLAAARDLYARAVAAAPGDTALAREYVDFLQFRDEDLDAAITALEEYRDHFGLDADGRYRLAQLYVWTDRGDAARWELESLVRDRPERADAWSLLGDVYRYADQREPSRTAYDHALRLDPADARAIGGLAELDRLRVETRASRETEPMGLGPSASLFRDSDEFLRVDLGGGTQWTTQDFVVGLDAGYRHLEGFDLAGIETDDDGVFAALEGARWWSESSVRASLRVGVDHLAAAGTEPVFGLSLAKFGASGSRLALRYDHGPAYPMTYTLESAIADVAADRVEVAAYAPFGSAWSIAVAAEAARLSLSGAASTRLIGGATLSRPLNPWLTIDAGTRVLGFTAAAPSPSRRLYWDPRLFWSNTVGLTVGRAPAGGVGYRLRLSGGAAYADERDAITADWIPQFAAEAGLSWSSERTDFELGVFYRRGRENEYNSGGGDLTLRWRP